MKLSSIQIMLTKVEKHSVTLEKIRKLTKKKLLDSLEKILKEKLNKPNYIWANN